MQKNSIAVKNTDHLSLKYFNLLNFSVWKYHMFGHSSTSKALKLIPTLKVLFPNPHFITSVIFSYDIVTVKFW